MNFEEIINGIENLATLEALIKSRAVVGRHHKIVVSISGGSDSDIVMDIIEKVKGDKQVEYVWFNTGLEYQATKDHLKFLEEKYGIKICEAKAVKSIPTCCKEYGVPFISKKVSEYMERLQRHGFKWEDKPFEVLYEEYPQCKAALRWWCNKWGEGSRFNIEYNKYLKEFIISNPPKCKISNKCCLYAKKEVAKNFIAETDADLNVVGIRKSEGGARATAYKNCFTANNDGIDQYRPIFWFRNDDKTYYERRYNVSHSACYSKYGLRRTGCAGCPYGRNFEQELCVIEEFEPRLFVAINNVFGAAYEYTRQYNEFCKMKKQEEHNEKTD